MDWTGVYYNFYITKSLDLVIKQIKIYCNKTGYSFNYNKFEEEESFLCFKNDEMLKYHLDNGYNTDLNGKGCFTIILKNTKLIGKATLFEFNTESNFDPFEIDLILNEINYLTLIVPDIIENDLFSKKIYTNVYNMLIKE